MHITPLEMTSPIWLTLIIISVITCIIMFIMIADELPYRPEASAGSRIKALIAKLSVMALAVVVITLSIGSMVNIAHRNGEAFVSNLKQKYEISEVTKIGDLTSPSAYLGFAEMEGETIEIKTTDGTRMLFLVSVDKQTFEPTLENPPVVGGSSMDKVPSAKDLLK